MPGRSWRSRAEKTRGLAAGKPSDILIITYPGKSTQPTVIIYIYTIVVFPDKKRFKIKSCFYLRIEKYYI